MDLFSVDILSDKELIKLVVNDSKHDREVNAEWLKRHEMNFPYQLAENGSIKDCMIKAYVADRECGQKVYDQAEILRKQNGLKG